MSQREVATLFCKILALLGIVWECSYLVIHYMQGQLLPNQQLGVVTSPVPFLLSLLSFKGLAFFGFVRMFARGIGRELAFENEEHPEPSKLMWRCLGLALLLWAALRLSDHLIALCEYWYWSSQPVSPPLPLMLPEYIWPEATLQAFQLVTGFALAFGARLRKLLHH